MSGLWWALMTGALAGEWERPVPYVRPVLYLQALSVNGVSEAFAVAGAEAGVWTRVSGAPGWASQTRLSASGIAGLMSVSFGADSRIGTFLGPEWKRVRILLGPDLWYGGFGRSDSLGYVLPWSVGLDAKGSMTVQVVRGLALVGEWTPGWALAPARQAGGVGPFHELTGLAALAIDTSWLRVTVGYRRRVDTVGLTEGLVFSGAL